MTIAAERIVVIIAVIAAIGLLVVVGVPALLVYAMWAVAQPTDYLQTTSPDFRRVAFMESTTKGGFTVSDIVVQRSTVRCLLASMEAHHAHEFVRLRWTRDTELTVSYGSPARPTIYPLTPDTSANRCTDVTIRLVHDSALDASATLLNPEGPNALEPVDNSDMLDGSNIADGAGPAS